MTDRDEAVDSEVEVEKNHTLQETSNSTSPCHDDDVEVGTKIQQYDSMASVGQAGSSSSSSSSSSSALLLTEEDVSTLREDLYKKLQEEQQLLTLQMELVSQLEELNASIVSTESEERMAKLALQQAQILRLMKQQSKDHEAIIHEESITITAPSFDPTTI